MTPGWYITERGTPLRVVGLEWDVSGLFSRTMILKITGHARTHIEVERWAPGYLKHRTKTYKLTPVDAPPPVYKKEDETETDIAALIARAEAMVAEWHATGKMPKP